MTIEAALNAFVGGNLQVEYQGGSEEINFTLRGDPEAYGEHTSYRWECWLSKTESRCIVEPPPHPWNDPPLGFVVANLDEAVSLILYMYEHRLSDRPALTSESAGYAQQLSEETKYTKHLYEEWCEGQR
jgi:hypothetical protein